MKVNWTFDSVGWPETCWKGRRNKSSVCVCVCVHFAKAHVWCKWAMWINDLLLTRDSMTLNCPKHNAFRILWSPLLWALMSIPHQPQTHWTPEWIFEASQKSKSKGRCVSQLTCRWPLLWAWCLAESRCQKCQNAKLQYWWTFWREFWEQKRNIIFKTQLWKQVHLDQALKVFWYLDLVPWTLDSNKTLQKPENKRSRSRYMLYIIVRKSELNKRNCRHLDTRTVKVVFSLCGMSSICLNKWRCFTLHCRQRQRMLWRRPVDCSHAAESRWPVRKRTKNIQNSVDWKFWFGSSHRLWCQFRICLSHFSQSQPPASLNTRRANPCTCACHGFWFLIFFVAKLAEL